MRWPTARSGRPRRSRRAAAAPSRRPGPPPCAAPRPPRRASRPAHLEGHVGRGRGSGGVWTEPQFWAAVLSSAPQPVGALIAYALVSSIQGLLAFSFAFAAGAMFALVAAELVPQAFRRDTLAPGVAGTMVGALLVIGAGGGARLERRPSEGFLHRSIGLPRRSRHRDQRRGAPRAAHASRLSLLDCHRHSSAVDGQR